jgi:tripartite-type tricarboxylate transporter receptor subunit TctC
MISSRHVRTLATALMTAALVVGAAGTARAAEFPNQPIKLIVPWPAGGTTDATLRALATAATKHMSQPVVVENRPGAAGTVGATLLATNTRPDGYTVAQLPISVFRQPVMTATAYDPTKDFTYIIHVSGYTFGVVVRTDSRWKTWNDLIAYAKLHPGEINYGSPGVGTSLHITMEQLAKQQGIRWTHVPYKGSAETTAALLGGHVHAVADSTGWASQVEAGQFRLLVTWGEQRTKRFPDVPTLKELGYGIVSTSPYGLAGPKDMNPAVVRVLHDGFKKALDDPEHVAVLERFDQAVDYKNSADYTAEARRLAREEADAMRTLGLANLPR